MVRRRTGDFQGAAESLEQALGIFLDLEHRLGQANALSSLGSVWQETGDYQAAAKADQEALDIYRDLGNRLGQANALGDLGIVSRQTGICRPRPQPRRNPWVSTVTSAIRWARPTRSTSWGY